MMGMKKKQAVVEAILQAAPVVPVMVIDDVKQAVPLARALVAGGLAGSRNHAAHGKRHWTRIRAIIAEVEGAIVGAGTVLTPDQFKQMQQAGLRLRRVTRSSPAVAGCCGRL